MPVKYLKKKKTVKTSSMVTHTKKKLASGAEVETHDESPMSFEVPTCDVTVSGGQTMNIGNYNSVRFSVAVRVPCVMEHLESTYSFAKEWVDQKLTAMQAEVTGEIKASTIAANEF